MSVRSIPSQGDQAGAFLEIVTLLDDAGELLDNYRSDDLDPVATVWNLAWFGNQGTLIVLRAHLPFAVA